MDFATKNNLIQKLKSVDNFNKDYRLFISLFPNHPLATKFRNSNQFTFERNDAELLKVMFEQGVTELEILENRNGQKSVKQNNVQQPSAANITQADAPDTDGEENTSEKKKGNILTSLGLGGKK
jgi:hypothetical protein